MKSVIVVLGTSLLLRGGSASCPYYYPSAVPACAPTSYECNTENAATSNVECQSLHDYCKPFRNGADEGVCVAHKTYGYAFRAPCITSNASAGTRDAIIASGARPVPLSYLECENTAPGLSCNGNIAAKSTSSQPYPPGVGTCVAALSGAGDACTSDLECPGDSNCQKDGTCYRLEQGDACDAATEFFVIPQCGKGLFCDVTQSTCQPAKSPGDPCSGYAGECGFEGLCVDMGSGDTCVAFNSLVNGDRDPSVDLAAVGTGPGAILPSALCSSKYAVVPPGGAKDGTPTCTDLPSGMDAKQYESCEGNDIGDHEDGLSCQCFPDGNKHWSPITGPALLNAKLALIDCLRTTQCPGGPRLIPATLDLDPAGGDVSSLLLPVTSCEYFSCYPQLQQASCAASTFEANYAYFAAESNAINMCASTRINETKSHVCDGGLQCQNLPGVSGLQCPSSGKKGLSKGAKIGIGATFGLLGAAGLAGGLWFFLFRGGSGMGSSYASMTGGASSTGASGSAPTASGFASVGSSNPF